MRRGVMVTAIVAAVVIVGVVVVLVVRGLGSSSAASGPECLVPNGAANLEIDAVQLQHASTINAVGLHRGLPERAMIIALATAYQESSLRNLDHGDRDSVGLFQQRPSQGWGRVDQIMDPVYAAGKFYDALVDVPGWQKLPLTEAAQAVQYSGFPDAYAKWETQAAALARQLGGGTTPGLSCRTGAQPVTAEQPDRAAVTGAAAATPGLAAVLGALQAEMGGVQVVSIADDGRSAVLTATVPRLPGPQRANAVAAWSVAHATSMKITTVAVADRAWSDHAWNPAVPPTAPAQVSVSVSP